MAFKITQCILPLVQQNKHHFLQVLNHPSTNQKSKNFADYASMSDKKCRQFGTFRGAKRHYAKLVNCNDKNGEQAENLAAVIHKPNELKVEQRPMPKINAEQVLLEMETVGICGTDVRFYADGKLGPWCLEEPIVTGHEASGTVVKVGEGVKDLQPGDKVAVEPMIPCRVCALCKLGKYHMCPFLRSCSIPPVDGTMCRYFAHDSDFCHKVPADLDNELATLMEPLAVAVHSCKKCCITCGDYVLILGAGPVGLAALQASKALGASRTLITDVHDYKLKKATEMGADGVINCKDKKEDDIIKCICETMGKRPNKSIDCCGFEAAVRIGILATADCGKVVVAGFGKDDYSLPLMRSVFKEIDILGAMKYANDYDVAIDMVNTGKVNLKPMITHHFKLEEAPKAFEMAAKHEEEYIKILVHTNPKWNSDDKNEEKKC